MELISFSFLFFVLIGVIVYYSIPKKVQYLWLLFLGIFFYAMNARAIPIFLIAGVISSYFYSRWFRNKIGLIIVTIFNVLLLFASRFYVSSSIARESSGLLNSSLLVNLGISFYTLQIIAYCVDVYKKKYEPEQNILKFILYITYFPQILQGPIPRFERLHNQFFKPHKFQYKQFVFGFELVLFGLFQKMVIADRAAIVVNRLFGEYESYKGLYVLVAGVLYSIQLYADFSGCVCIAKGVSQMFDIQIEDNFDHPYFSISIKDFWRRWHRSFSDWLKNYIYIPLGGNRQGKIRKYVNVLVTFLVSGVWHGMGLHYVAWGLLHGLYQILGEIFQPVRDFLVTKGKLDRNSFSHKLFKQAVTYFLVVIAWIFFRADSVRIALKMIRNLFVTFNPQIFLTDELYMLGLNTKEFQFLVVSIFMFWGISYLQTKIKIREFVYKQHLLFRFSILYIVIFMILIFGIYGPGYDVAQFIYGAF